MQITHEKQMADTATIHLSGRLDLLTAAEVKQHLVQMVSDGYCKLVIDMTNITFIDSTGLGALISGLKATRKAGGDMRLACPGEQTLTLLRLTSLDRVLHPYATVDAAQASYK